MEGGDDLYPRLSSLKLQQLQQQDLGNYKSEAVHKTERQRHNSNTGVSGVADQAELIQAYTNNALAYNNGNGANRNKLQKLRHPSSTRRQENQSASLAAIGIQPRNEQNLNTSISQHGQNFDQLQGLREQNQQLKGKMAQLNLALDTVMQDKQSSRPPRLPQANSRDGSSFGDSPGLNVDNIKLPAQRGSQTQLQLDLHKQQEINRRLNELLNGKDDEIASLSQRVMQLEEELNNPRSPVRSVGRKGISGKSPKSGYVGVNGTVTDLQNKMIDMEQKNKELQKEIKLLQRIQDRQGNALQNMDQDGYTEKQVQAVMADLRVKTEQNKKLKYQIVEVEKTNKSTHEHMMRLEQTIKELKTNAVEQKKLQAKSKQTERLNDASEKIDELIQANQYLNTAKENAVKLSGKQRQQYARQMAALHHRIDYLSRLLEENGVEVNE